MTLILKTSQSEDPYRPQCSACNVDMWLTHLKRSFARGEMKEQRSYECLACGDRRMIAVPRQERPDVQRNLQKDVRKKNSILKKFQDRMTRHLVELGAASGSVRLRDDERG